jgi:hypothetical protein
MYMDGWERTAEGDEVVEAVDIVRIPSVFLDGSGGIGTWRNFLVGG